MICATLVNTQTHTKRQTDSLQPVVLLAQPAQLKITETDLTIDADTTTFVHTVNVDAKMSLGNSFIVDTRVSMAKTIALCTVINNTHVT